MKITPVASGGTNMNSMSVGQERTSPERIASAKAVLEGQQPMRMTKSDTPVDPQATRAQEAMRRIKMKTNHSTDRGMEQINTIPEAVVGEQSVIPDTNEGVAIEETKPLSPQFAALAKQRRALQVKERELEAREKAQQTTPTTDGGGDLAARLKSETLSVLQEQGALTPEFYNAMTEYLMSGQGGINPELQALKAEIKALKEGVDKNFVDRDTAAEQQVLSEMRKEAESLAKEGDAFELVRETKSIPKVIDLIHRTYKNSGEVMDVTEALNLVEQELAQDALKIAKLNKIRAQLTPQQQVSPQQSQPNQMRTITNRDSTTAPLDRRSRMLLAMTGQLKRG